MFTSVSSIYPKIGIQSLVWSLPRGDMKIRARCEYTPTISALKKLGQEDGEFRASLGYIVPG